MQTLNIDKLKRNPDAIKQSLKKIGNSLIAKKRLRVIFPDRYTAVDMAIVGSTVRLASIYAILDDEGNYSVSNLPIFVELTPSNISNIEIDGNVNKILIFEEDSVFMPDTKLVIDNRFLYDFFNEFYVNGRVPWFMSYNDLIDIFKLTSKYADSNLGDNPITMEILASIVARDTNDKTKFFRETINSPKDITNKPASIGLMNIYYTFNNTISKLTGSYFQQGLNSAIVNKEKESTLIEDILRA